ncbi:MAG TPA: TetR/AcrR family transcriptional regulator [Terracidiphilus sp.]|jgi:AcrR family transcriptional regulator
MARTRSTEVHQRILEAALRLFSERGFESTSMDSIARDAGVTKPTLYNHWTDKEALMMEVMLYVNGIRGEREEFDSGSLVDDLAWVLTRRPPDEFEELRMRMMPGLVAYSATHPAFGAAWRNNILTPARQALTKALERGMKRGEISRGFDMDVALCLLLGPMLYRHIFHGKADLEIEIVGREVAQAFARAYINED